jgi:hypothetical protein
MSHIAFRQSFKAKFACAELLYQQHHAANMHKLNGGIQKTTKPTHAGRLLHSRCRDTLTDRTTCLHLIDMSAPCLSALRAAGIVD